MHPINAKTLKALKFFKAIQFISMNFQETLKRNAKKTKRFIVNVENQQKPDI